MVWKKNNKKTRTFDYETDCGVNKSVCPKIRCLTLSFFYPLSLCTGPGQGPNPKVCPDYCPTPSSQQMVCGTNGQSYKSACLLQVRVVLAMIRKFVLKLSQHFFTKVRESNSVAAFCGHIQIQESAHGHNNNCNNKVFKKCGGLQVVRPKVGTELCSPKFLFCCYWFVYVLFLGQASWEKL